MKIHKEGKATILIVLVLLLIINSLSFALINMILVNSALLVLSMVFFYLILHFFRIPHRQAIFNENHLLAPADGKLVAIEEITENEYFKDKRKQVSIFMSPLNVHINWYPISGKISYYRYIPGKHLVAFNPKSSTDNERTTVVIKTANNKEIMVRQIAGAVARRVVCYTKEQKEVKQGDELGFIKFGSRVDIILPLDVDVKVTLDQIITGKQTIIAEM